MADFMTPEQRHNNMSRIRGKDTTPEVYIRKLLFNEGFRYRIHSKHIPGRPDIWMRKYNTAIFINGCFWHRHQGCKYAYMPKSRIDFWKTKFDKNIERDNNNRLELIDRGIRFAVIWECTIKKMQKSPEFEKEVMEAISHFITGMEEKVFEI